jgi:hypothetical protein
MCAAIALSAGIDERAMLSSELLTAGAGTEAATLGGGRFSQSWDIRADEAQLDPANRHDVDNAVPVRVCGVWT